MMRKKMKERLRPFKFSPEDFRNWEFVIAVIAAIIMQFLAFFGNPRFFDTILRWHHIPELVAFFFLGSWLAKAKKPFIYVMFIYLMTGFLTPLIMITTVPPEFLRSYLLIVPITIVIATPLPIGYIVHISLVKNNGS